MELNKDAKTAAITAYLTIVGTLIAFFMNHEDKHTFANFHLKQAFGLHITFYLIGILVSLFNSIIIVISFYVFFLALWIYGISGAITGKEKLIPILGTYFQKWLSKTTK